jgi:hypothetical protein
VVSVRVSLSYPVFVGHALKCRHPSFLLSAWSELAFAGLEADLGTSVQKNRLLQGHAPSKNPLSYNLPVLIWSPLSRATRRLALSVLVGSVIIDGGFILVRQRFCQFPMG